MKKLFFLFCISFASNFLQAQTIPFNIQKSDVFEDKYKHSKIVLAENDGTGGVIIVRHYKGGIFSSGIGYYFEHYNSEMKLIKESDYPMKFSDFERQSSVLGIILDNDKIHIVDFLYNQNEKAYICSANTANISDFKFDKNELFRIKSEEIKQSSSFFTMGQLDGDSGATMIMNEDRSAFAITIDLKNAQIESHQLFLFDKQLNKKIDHVFKREIKDRKFSYENIDVSKDGNTLYLLGKVYTNEAKKKKEGGKYQFELTRITKDSEKTQVFDTDEHFSGSLKTIIFEDRLTCIGFFSDRNDSRYKGISYFELDPGTLEIRKSRFNLFTEQFMIDKYGKDKDKELRNLSFRKILITPNNEIVFNAEEFYVTTNYHYSPNGGSSTSTSYHYDDIVSAKISISGDLAWARNINKRQATSGDDSYISYTSTVKDNNVYFFINTGEKVRKLRNDRIQFGQTSTKRSNLNIIRINQDGDFEYQEILDDKENEVPFMVSEGVLSNNSVFFIGRKGKKKQLLKISL
jgi:hypothetical protein